MKNEEEDTYIIRPNENRGKRIGRERTYDREKIAQEMIEWAQLDSSVNLNGFCAIKLIPPGTLLRWKDEEHSFRESYELVKSILGNRREKMVSDGSLHVKAFAINATNYDKFLKEETREEYKFLNDLKMQEKKSYDEEDILRAQHVLEWVSKHQSDSSDLTK